MNIESRLSNLKQNSTEPADLPGRQRLFENELKRKKKKDYPRNNLGLKSVRGWKADYRIIEVATKIHLGIRKMKAWLKKAEEHMNAGKKIDPRENLPQGIVF